MTDVNLYRKVGHLHGLLQRRKLRLRANGGPLGDPTQGQGRILAMLKIQDGIPTKELSYLLGLQVASLNELLAKLERAGLVTREPSEADRRIMLVKLTDDGRETPQQNPDAGGAFAVLTAEEQETLGGYLDRIIAGLESETHDVDAETLQGWMDEARARMGDEKFDRWVGMLTTAFGPEGYQAVLADRLRRAGDRMGRKRGRGDRDREKLRRRFRGYPEFADFYGPEDLDGPDGPDGPGFRGPGPRPGGPGFGPGPRPGFGPGPHRRGPRPDVFPEPDFGPDGPEGAPGRDEPWR